MNLTSLGQTKVPAVFAKVQAKGLTDLMDITGETRSQGSGGGQVKSAAPNVYSNVPVTYEKNRRGMRLTVGDRPVAVGEFLLRFPVYHNGSRINLDALNHKLRIQARGLEPAKTFQIKGEPFDNQGVLWEVEAELVK